MVSDVSVYGVWALCSGPCDEAKIHGRNAWQRRDAQFMMARNQNSKKQESGVPIFPSRGNKIKYLTNSGKAMKMVRYGIP